MYGHSMFGVFKFWYIGVRSKTSTDRVKKIIEKCLDFLKEKKYLWLILPNKDE